MTGKLFHLPASMNAKGLFLNLCRGVLSLLPVIFLEGIRWIADDPFSWSSFSARLALIGLLLLLVGWKRFYWLKFQLFQLWIERGIIVAGLIITLIYVLTNSTWSAWGTIFALYVLLLNLDKFIRRRDNIVVRWGGMGFLALVGGGIPVAITQIETNFAEEEFFTAIQLFVLLIFWLLLYLTANWRPNANNQQGISRSQSGYYWPVMALGILFSFGMIGMVRAYQHSFYATQVPLYRGISAEAPFLCGQAMPDQKVYQGETVFARLLDRVVANPNKGAPEYGMLALGSGQADWAQAFRESILDEAQTGKFAGPAHSLKSIQYEAALRAYYLPRVQAAFPGLFSETDMVLLRAWFADINQRALTVEWVDWMYGLAFSTWPEGPYENQDIGLGLLALLEVENLAAANLRAANQSYLAHNQRGWEARFRNVDDSIIYQPAWINNAYFQSFYTDEVPEDNLIRSFAWILLQALPDGSILEYNYPFQFPLSGSAYFGAHLLQESEYLWLAGRTLDRLEAEDGYLFAQPGVEQSVFFEGRSPTYGSCLMYGDSGVPTQLGPLAPDKIIFRDGWTVDAAYLMLNLRFTGWHRYKATNAVTLVYQQGPLAAEISKNTSFSWLPAGRSLLRDKRIPRENLNGILIERSGMSAVLYRLTGIGGHWAQDPPAYAQVMAFETGKDLDWSHTRIANWRNWQHDRWIYFYHQGGPIVIVDQARGPSTQAALMWHLNGGDPVSKGRVRLRAGDQPAEMLLLPFETHPSQREIITKRGDGSDLSMMYKPQAKGKLEIITLFLFGPWVGAEATFDPTLHNLSIVQGELSLSLSLEVE